MMRLVDIVNGLELEVLTPDVSLDGWVTAGYAADLLSCVMARARECTLWITLQAHPNVVSVSSMLNLAGVVITEGSHVPPDMIARAIEEGVPLLTTPATTYAVAGRLMALGIPEAELMASG
jgi:serine kinase of HPr protein (carbohydrate metabolism regulator)